MYSGVSSFSEHFILHSVPSVASHTLPHNITVAIQVPFCQHYGQFFLNQHNLLLLAYKRRHCLQTLSLLFIFVTSS